jgi:hypothetical protein
MPQTLQWPSSRPTRSALVNVYTGDSPPPSPFQGQLWLDTTTARLFIWYINVWLGV